MENFLPLPSDTSNGCSFTALTSVCGGDSNNCNPETGCVSPLILTTSLGQMAVGEPFEFVLQGSGSYPRTWSIYTGELPPGLSLDTATGTISGTPTTQDLYNIYLLLENACGSATQYLNGEIEVVTQPRVKWGLLYPEFYDPNNFSGQFVFNSPPSGDNKLQEEDRNALVKAGGYSFETFDTLTPFVQVSSGSPALNLIGSGWTRPNTLVGAGGLYPQKLVVGLELSCLFAIRTQMRVENLSATADTYTFSQTGTMTVNGLTGITPVINATSSCILLLTAYDGVLDYGGIFGNSGSGATLNNLNGAATALYTITPGSSAWNQLMAGPVLLSVVTTDGPPVVTPVVNVSMLFTSATRADIAVNISYRRWAGYFWMMIPFDWPLPAAIGGFKLALDNSNVVMASMDDGYGTSEENGCGYEEGYEFPFFSPDYKIVRSLNPYYGGDVGSILIVP